MTKPTNSNVEGELRQRLGAWPQDRQTYQNLADHLVSSGRLNDAISLYEEILKRDVGILEKARVATELGWLLYEMGKLDRGQALAKSAFSQLAEEEETPDVLLSRGMSQSLAAHCIWYKDEASGAEIANAALSWIERLITTFPESQDIAAAYYTAARLHSLLGHPKETIALCRKVLQYELTPLDRISCLVVHGGALRMDGQLNEAETTLLQALGHSDIVTLPRLYFELGLVHRLMDRTTEAEEDFKKALETLHTHPYLHDDVHFLQEANWNLAEVCYDLEKYREAASAFQQVYGYLSLGDPNHWNALLWVGYCYQAMGEHSNARDCYRQVLESSSASSIDKALAQKGVGEIHYELEEYEEAALAFETFLAAYSEDDTHYRDALLWLGCCYEAKGDYEKARDCFDRVLASPYTSESGKTAAHEGLARLPQVSKKTVH